MSCSLEQRREGVGHLTDLISMKGGSDKMMPRLDVYYRGRALSKNLYFYSGIIIDIINSLVGSNYILKTDITFVGRSSTCE